MCGNSLSGEEPVKLDHIISKKERGSDDINNMQALHKICHQQKTFGSGRKKIVAHKKL
jgi:5-methylcytosine-specific restriction endonuclease McrA